MTRRASGDFICRAVTTLQQAVGTRPLGWLSRYLFTERTRRLLVEEGFFYHMDDYADDVPRWDVVETGGRRRGIVVVPYALDTNDMKFWLAPGYTPEQWLDYAVASFEQLYEEGRERPAIMSLGVASAHHRSSGPDRPIQPLPAARAQPTGGLADIAPGDRQALRRADPVRVIDADGSAPP